MSTKKELQSWQVDQSQPYFYYDAADCGFSYFGTEKERDEKANEAIQEYLHMDGWNDDEVTHIVSGTMTGVATMIDKEYPKGKLDEDGCDEEGEFWSSDCDYNCNYAIKPLDHVEPK